MDDDEREPDPAAGRWGDAARGGRHRPGAVGPRQFVRRFRPVGIRAASGRGFRRVAVGAGWRAARCRNAAPTQQKSFRARAHRRRRAARRHARGRSRRPAAEQLEQSAEHWRDERHGPGGRQGSRRGGRRRRRPGRRRHPDGCRQPARGGRRTGRRNGHARHADRRGAHEQPCRLRGDEDPGHGLRPRHLLRQGRRRGRNAGHRAAPTRRGAEELALRADRQLGGGPGRGAGRRDRQCARARRQAQGDQRVDHGGQSLDHRAGLAGDDPERDAAQPAARPTRRSCRATRVARS